MRKRKILKAIDGLSIKDAVTSLLGALDAVVKDANHEEVYLTVAEMLEQLEIKYRMVCDD